MSILDSFGAEQLILHKKDGTTFTVTAFVDDDMIHSEDVDINVEENDIYERTLPNGSKEYYRITDRGFFTGGYGIPDNYQSKVEKIPAAIAEREMNGVVVQEKPHKLFISHSSKDADYVEAFVSLLEILGLREEEIICSSVPPYCIPLGNKVYDWLVKEFQQSELHVVYALSEHYYASAASLNEMGAAWAMKQKWTGLLLPGFSFDRLDGCIDKTQISIKLDDADTRTLNFRLGELKNEIIAEFGLRAISEASWERHRDDFLRKITEIAGRDQKKYSKKDDIRNENPIRNIEDDETVPIEAAFLLVYAAAGDGQIIKLAMLGSPVQVSADGKQFMKENSPRESARWQEGLAWLCNRGWVKPCGTKGQVFEVTGTGYKKADWLKDAMEIDTDVEPVEEIKNFE